MHELLCTCRSSWQIVDATEYRWARCEDGREVQTGKGQTRRVLLPSLIEPRVRLLVRLMTGRRAARLPSLKDRARASPFETLEGGARSTRAASESRSMLKEWDGEGALDEDRKAEEAKVREERTMREVTTV